MSASQFGTTASLYGGTNNFTHIALAASVQIVNTIRANGTFLLSNMKRVDFVDILKASWRPPVAHSPHFESPVLDVVVVGGGGGFMGR